MRCQREVLKASRWTTIRMVPPHYCTSLLAWKETGKESLVKTCHWNPPGEVPSFCWQAVKLTVIIHEQKWHNSRDTWKEITQRGQNAGIQVGFSIQTEVLRVWTLTGILSYITPLLTTASTATRWELHTWLHGAGTSKPGPPNDRAQPMESFMLEETSTILEPSQLLSELPWLPLELLHSHLCSSPGPGELGGYVSSSSFSSSSSQPSEPAESMEEMNAFSQSSTRWHFLSSHLHNQPTHCSPLPRESPPPWDKLKKLVPFRKVTPWLPLQAVELGGFLPSTQHISHSIEASTCAGDVECLEKSPKEMPPFPPGCCSHSWYGALRANITSGSCSVQSERPQLCCESERTAWNKRKAASIKQFSYLNNKHGDN